LSTALLNGCISIEADVWLREDQVVVGHTEASISSKRTLSSLYIEPLLHLLSQKYDEEMPAGVFDSNPSQTLVLVLDFKKYTRDLWDHVSSELEPLRQKEHLTFFDGKTLHMRAITIVVSGDAPLSDITTQTPIRDMFYDAPLQVFSQPSPQDLPRTTNSSLTHDLDLRSSSPTNPDVYSQANSYYASGNFKSIVGHVWRSKLSDAQLDVLRTQIREAHARGLKVRYWGVPSWPLGIRNYMWRVLIREGVDILSVEDVYAVAHDNWGPRKGGCMTGDLM
jgi:hypothetical protein